MTLSVNNSTFMFDGKQMYHVAITGMTGSGKSYLTREYLRHSPVRIIAIDTKGDLETPWENVIYVESISALQKQLSTPFDYVKGNHIVYRPDPVQAGDRETIEKFFEICFYTRPCIVWVDEVMSVSTSSRIPTYYNGILTRGRSIGVGVVSLTQRPANIPQVIYSESTHWFVFRLNKMEDRERFYNYSGALDFLGFYYKFGGKEIHYDVDIPLGVQKSRLDKVKVVLDKFHFLYYNNGTGIPPQVMRLKNK